MQLPKTVYPFFRQYYDWRQVAAFGDGVLFLPLGSRAEFPDISPSQIQPASSR